MRRNGWSRPEVLLPLTFLGAIAAGTLLLLVPGMSRGGVGPLEALFTSVSAVCVTGLAVVDTGTEFTRRGQAVIMVLIQAGGLGIMTFSVLVLLVAGRRVALEQEAQVRETFSPVAGWNVGRLLGLVLLSTLAIEAAGFLLLWHSMGDAWSAAFHAVSAFCNAGFSLMPDSLQRAGPAVVLTVLGLVVLGGLGFTTILELVGAVAPGGGRARRFSLHARLVLRGSILLWGLGTLLLALAMGGDLRHAVFMSASARTAGFDTVPVASLPGAALLILMPLMFIGASPGSTGGGIKTTTLGVALALVRTILRGRDQVVVDGREIPRDVLRRMFAVIACSAVVVFVAILLLDLFEGDRPGDLLPLAFEAVSAFGTVGLSTGVTPALQPASKLLLCVVMFVGRVGSLSFFLLLVREVPASRVRYPEERVLIG